MLLSQHDGSQGWPCVPGGRWEGPLADHVPEPQSYVLKLSMSSMGNRVLLMMSKARTHKTRPDLQTQ